MNTNNYPITDIKAAVLKGDSYRKVADRYNVSGALIHKLLADDPDIVAAKASGKLRGARNGSRMSTARGKYQDLPYVIDVIQHGMSTAAAAKKHGISQPVVWEKVRSVRAQMEAATPTPTPQSTPPMPETLLTATKDLSEAFAKAHAAGLSTAAIIKIMSDSLPPTP